MPDTHLVLPICLHLSVFGAAKDRTLNSLFCASNSMTGAGTDRCTVTLDAAAASGGLGVKLSSNNAAVKVPTGVTVPAGATSASFTATVAAVQTAQTVTIEARAGIRTIPVTYSIQLNGVVPTLSISTSSVAFGNVIVNTPSTATLTLTSSGTAVVTVESAALTAAGFTISGATFPVTLNPGQTTTLTIQFDPTSVGATSGQLTITSSSSTNSTAAVGLSGTGMAAPLSALSCSNNSITGAGSYACTVTLSGPAASGGQSVSMSSSNAAVTLPALVTVLAGGISASFTESVTAVTTTTTVMLTATQGSVSKTFTEQLNAFAPTLTVATSNSPSTYGSAVSFTATISSGPTGSVTFLDGGFSIGTGTINGTTAALKTSALNAGSHTITASWPGSSSYGAVTSGAIAQVVNKAAPSISWAAPAAILYGTALSVAQLDASSTMAGTFAYTPAAGTVLKTGAQTLSVTFTPTDSTDYSAPTATVLLTVNATAPSISWAAPAAILYGTALNSTQLNATSTVPGAFVYSPAAGTVPAVGSQILSVTFTPTDTADYSAATQTVTLTVNQSTSRLRARA